MRQILKCRHVFLAFSLLFALHFAVADDYEKGRQAANAGDYAEAYYYWKPLADKGNARAMFNIGRMYARGDGMRKDFAKAHAFFEAAARQGDSEAAEKLGHMYFYGDGVKRDLATAKRWYALALKNKGGNTAAPNSDGGITPAPYPKQDRQQPASSDRYSPPLEPLPERSKTGSSQPPTYGGDLSSTTPVQSVAPVVAQQPDISSGSARDRDIVVYSDGNPDAGLSACLIAAEQTHRDTARMATIAAQFKEVIGSEVSLPRCKTGLAPYVLIELELVDLTRIVTVDILKQKVLRGELARIETLTID